MVKTALKFVIALVLIFWLVSSGKLDFSLIKKSAEVGPYWLIALSIMACQATFAAFRFKKIIEIKTEQRFHFLEILKLNWIGLFFSSILPGAVTGDLIKIYYLKRLEPNFKKSFLVTAVFLDRILGMLGLLFVCGVFSLISFQDIIKISPLIKHIIQINFLLFIGGVVFFIILFSTQKTQKVFEHLLLKIPKIGIKLVHTFEHIFSLNQHRFTFFICFLISVLNQFLNMLAFYIVASPFFEIHIPLSFAFTIIPIGLITVALPISPAGLGIGHALFQNIFSMVGIHNGASLFNLYFLISISVNLFGAIPYLLAGKKPNADEMQEFN